MKKFWAKAFGLFAFLLFGILALAIEEQNMPGPPPDESGSGPSCGEGRHRVWRPGKLKGFLEEQWCEVRSSYYNCYVVTCEENEDNE